MHIGIVNRSQVDYALDLANELHQAGFSVTLYLSYQHTVLEVGDSNRPIERLYESGLVPLSCKVCLVRPPRMLNPRSFAVFRELSRTIIDDGVELVHILLNPEDVWFALLANLLRTIPVVSTIIVPQYNVGDFPPALIEWMINKLATLGSDQVIVNGADQVELMQRSYWTPANRLNYVPLSLHTRATKWRGKSVAEEPGTILFFGAARLRKGLEYLIRAQPLISRQVPYARILISAHGEDLPRCLQMIQDKSKFEIHEGFVAGDIMANYFQRASLVALPYLTASTSGVLMTAYSYAKPVVSTRVGCLPEYVEEGRTGLLVPPSNVEQLADAIVRLLLDDALRHRMGENALRWIEEKQKSITAQTLEVYDKAMHDKGRAI